MGEMGEGEDGMRAGVGEWYFKRQWLRDMWVQCSQYPTTLTPGWGGVSVTLPYPGLKNRVHPPPQRVEMGTLGVPQELFTSLSSLKEFL